MTNTQSKTANILGGKTARACDSCLRKRARWFCAADDAFLCQNCDTSVHSANQLASRHERVRLETASCKIKLDHIMKPSSTSTSTSWHQGFTKKPRTPRTRQLSVQQLLHDYKDDHDGRRKTREWNQGFLVPEISGEDASNNIDENEEREKFLYRVPVLDPFDTELCNEMDDINVKDSEFDDLDVFLNDHDASRMNDIPGFISSDIVQLEELAHAVDSLLGSEIEEDSRVAEGLCGIPSCLEDDKRFKIEKENNQQVETVNMECRYDPAGLDTTSESFNWDFDYSMTSPIDGEDDEEIRINTWDFPTRDLEMEGKEKRRINLKLNYDGVISAWDCQSSPWIDGIKPEDFSLDDCWPDFMESGSGNDENRNGVVNNVGRCWDGEREARVLRYREKRRKRLFAKKIRYQVRKLNAEKRPRMKGRFVKRTSFAESSLPSNYMMINK